MNQIWVSEIKITKWARRNQKDGLDDDFDVYLGAGNFEITSHSRAKKVKCVCVHDMDFKVIDMRIQLGDLNGPLNVVVQDSHPISQPFWRSDFKIMGWDFSMKDEIYPKVIMG